MNEIQDKIEVLKKGEQSYDKKLQQQYEIQLNMLSTGPIFKTLSFIKNREQC